MLFSEVYSSYYNAVAQILSLAAANAVTGSELYSAVQQKAFCESITVIPDSLRKETWPLLLPDGTTPLEHTPTMPLTTLQKRWLKSLLSDPRIQLFSPSVDGLEDVRPLFSPDTFVYYDRYSDGDDYNDPRYISHFRTVLAAIREKRMITISFTGSNGTRKSWRCAVQRLEYSSKDDKFRALVFANRRPSIINIARITSCRLLEESVPQSSTLPEPVKEELVLELTDRRNSLERAMIAFSDMEKETRKLDDLHYRISLKYYREDETEMLIRVLSFGPAVRVVAPDTFLDLLKSRIDRQTGLMNLT